MKKIIVIEKAKMVETEEGKKPAIVEYYYGVMNNGIYLRVGLPDKNQCLICGKNRCQCKYKPKINYRNQTFLKSELDTTKYLIREYDEDIIVFINRKNFNKSVYPIYFEITTIAKRIIKKEFGD